MRIYWFEDISSGCGHVRVSLPMRELVRRGHKCAVEHGQFMIDTLQWDAVVLGRLPIGSINDMLPEFTQRGIKIIYDIDDALDLLEPANLSYARITSHIETYFNLLRTADMITVTTRELAAHVRKFAPAGTRIAILPNCVRTDEWQQRSAGNRIPRIGFTGSHSRLADLREVLETIKSLQQDGLRESFEFVIFGISSSHRSFEGFYRDCANTPSLAAQTPLMETLDAIRSLLTAITHQWEPAVPVLTYARKLADLNLDLGLCPLRPTDFNRHKSCLKAYEYAMAGTEVMCARTTPYADELPETLFPMVEHGAQAWHAAIAGWVRTFSSARNVETARAQRAWVLEHRSIAANSQLWETEFSNLLAKT